MINNTKITSTDKTSSDFKEKEFKKIVKRTSRLCLKTLGYHKSPKHIYGNNFTPTAIMELSLRGKHCYFKYDYNRFMEDFKQDDYYTCKLYTFLCTAHEMRHYYQVKQIFSRKTALPESLLDEWDKAGDAFKKIGNDGYTENDYINEPTEVDADLFALLMGIFYCDSIAISLFYNKERFNLMEKRYIDIFGKTDETIFNQKYLENL